MIDPRTLQGRRPLRGRRAPAARHAVLGPEDAVRAQRRGQLASRRSTRERRSPAARSTSTTRTTCTSRPTAASRSSSPSACTASTSATRTRSALHHSLTVPCRGVDHMDFSADGGYLLASCEFSGQLIKVDLRSQRVVGVLSVPGGAMPQDVKLSPDGKVFYVADMHANGLWEVDGRRLRVIGFLPTGLGVHGLYPSRDGKLPVRNEPQRRHDLRDQLQDAEGGRDVADSGRKPRHGQRLRERAGSSGCRAATTPRCTRSRPARVVCSRGSPSAPGRTGSASGRSPGGTPWGTPESSAETTATRRV